jgi:large subunit ribosomal protein L29
MKYAEIKELSLEEIKDRITEERANLTKLKFGHAVSALENPMQIRSLRKTIAKLNTELKAREAKAIEA